MGGWALAPGPLLEACLGNRSVVILDPPLRRDYWSDWSFFCNYYASLSLSLLSSESVHAFTHVVLFVYHSGLNLLTNLAPGPLLEACLGNRSVVILDPPLRRDYWSDWSFFCNYYASLSLSLLSSESVHAFTHVVLFVYHTGLNLLTVHVFFLTSDWWWVVEDKCSVVCILLSWVS